METLSKLQQRHNLVISIARLGFALYLLRVGAELGTLIIDWPSGAIIGGCIGVLANYVYWQHLPARRHNNLSHSIGWAYVLTPAINTKWMLVVGATIIIVYLVVSGATFNYGFINTFVFVGALSTYWLTLSSGLLPADAGEFQLVATTLQVAHPPGYPLYTLIGKIFTFMFPHNPIMGVNLFSAVTMALTVTLVGRSVHQLTGSTAGAVTSAAMFATASSVWSVATQASIRPLTAFFAALCVERLIKYTQNRTPATLSGFALAFGLGVTHHPSLVFSGIFHVVYLWLIDSSFFVEPQRWARPAGAFLLGFIPWLYIPLIALIKPDIVSGGLATWDGFWNHVLARGFAGDVLYFRTLTDVSDRLPIFLNILQLQWNIVIVFSGLIAIAILIWKNWRISILLVGSFLLHSLVTMTYRAPQTVEYLIPAYVSLVIMIGAAGGYLLELKKNEVQQSTLTGLGALGIAFIMSITLVQGAEKWRNFRVLAVDSNVAEHSHALLSAAPDNAIILANWHQATPLWVLQQVEGIRPDVEVIYVFPEGISPEGDTFMRRIEANLAERPVMVTNYFPAVYSAASYQFEPLEAGWLVRTTPSVEVPAGFKDAEYPFDNGMTLIGFDIDESELASSDTVNLRLAWRVDNPVDTSFTGFVHLTHLDGRFISGRDRRLSTEGVEVGSVIVESYKLNPSLDLAPGEYVLQAGTYSVTPDGTLVNGLHDGQLRASFETVTISSSEWPAPTKKPLHALFGNGAQLRGIDRRDGVVYLHAVQTDGTNRSYQTTVDNIASVIREEIAGESPMLGPGGVPVGNVNELTSPDDTTYIPFGGQMIFTGVEMRSQGVEPGDDVIVDLEFLSSRPLVTDNVISLRVIGQDGAWIAQSDSIPAMGAVPTLKWLYGWRVLDRHRIQIPTDATTPPSHIDLLVYDNFEGQYLNLQDPALAEAGITVTVYQWTP